jgi:N-acetylglucosamine-6-phosphate deacetylase
MTCFGIDPFTGEHLAIEFETGFRVVDTLIAQPASGTPYIAPAWIDLQVNGYAGVDFNSPHATPEEIRHAIAVLHSTGTARFFPTVITGSPEDMEASLRNLWKARQQLGAEGEAIEGFHVEGPHISPEDGPRGAHPKRWVRPPDLEEYRRWQEATEGHIRLVTLSPEWPEAPRYIEQLVSEGVVVSIGHTQATSEQIAAAVSAGASLSTHLGNGAHRLLPRHPNYIWDQLAEDRLCAGFIVDGIHLPASFVRVALRAKGLSRSLLVTDASMPACAPPGIYRLGEQEVELTEDNRVVLRGQNRLAGSALRMNDAISNVIRMTGISLAEALSLASRNPARVGRIVHRQRGLAPGERADFVLFDYDPQTHTIRIRETWLSGRRVFKASD